MGELYNPLRHSVVQACLKADKWQRFECPDFVECLVWGIKSELDLVYWNFNQKSLDDREDREFLEISCFEYRRYFWDDCDCGADSPVHANDCRMIVEHDEWNRRRLDAISDPPQNPITEEEILEAEKRGVLLADYVMSQCYRLASTVHFERSGAWVAENPGPPCTCGAKESWKPRDEHLPTCSPQQPNMKFGEVTVNWYKHIGRGMSVNVDWDANRWREWFDEAMKALSLYDTCGQHGHTKLRDLDAGREPFSVYERVQCRDCKYCIQFGANAYIKDRKGP
jgi:hypothetical protein